MTILEQHILRHDYLYCVIRLLQLTADESVQFNLDAQLTSKKSYQDYFSLKYEQYVIAKQPEKVVFSLSLAKRILRFLRAYKKNIPP